MTRLETWKPVPALSGVEASSKGRVKYFSRSTGRWRRGYGNPNGEGYRFVTHDGQLLRVHTLVACAFLENEKGHKIANHKNRMKGDNRPENLEWCTASDNVRHAHATRHIPCSPKINRVRLSPEVQRLVAENGAKNSRSATREINFALREFYSQNLVTLRLDMIPPTYWTDQQRASYQKTGIWPGTENSGNPHIDPPLQRANHSLLKSLPSKARKK